MNVWDIALMLVVVLGAYELWRLWRNGKRVIDLRTGRGVGDHGSPLDAIDFAMTSKCEDSDTFLRAWYEGSLDEWPEFYEWLAEREKV